MENENQNYKEKIIILNNNDIKLSDIYYFYYKLILFLTKNGKKLKYSKYFNKVFINFKLNGYNSLIILKSVIYNLKPYIGIKVTRFGRRKITFPILLSKKRSYYYIFKWISESLFLRIEKKFEDRLYNELLDISNNKGISINKLNQFNLNVIKMKPFLWKRYLNKKNFLKKNKLGNKGKKNSDTLKNSYNKQNKNKFKNLSNKRNKNKFKNLSNKRNKNKQWKN